MGGSSQEKGKGAAAALWVPSFDGVRGFVSLSILLIHVQLAVGWRPNHELPGALRASWFFSIEFLFLMGGFVALLPVVAYGAFPGTRRYAIRRAGRLLPLYWLTLGLAVLLGGLLRPVTGTEFPHDLGAVLAHLVFLQHIVMPFESGLGVHGIVWTMTIVACFYAAFALSAGSYLRHPVLGLAVALAIAVAWRTQVDLTSSWFLQFPVFVSDFAVGMTAAWAYARLRASKRAPRPAPAAIWATASLAALGAMLYAAGLPIRRGENLYFNEGVFLDVAVPVAFASFLIALAFAPRWFQWPAANRVARKLGDISYGLFLFHFLVIWLVLRYVDIPRNGSVSSLVYLTALAFPFTVALAWLGTRYVERPLRSRAHAFADRFGGRRVGTAPRAPESPEPAPAPAPAA